MQKLAPQKNNILETFIVFFMFIYIFTTIFMPQDNFGVKKIFFVLCVLFSVFELYNYAWNKEIKFVLFFGFALIAFLIIISIIITSNIFSPIQRGFSGFYLLFYLSIVTRKSKFRYYFIFCLKIMALVIIIGVLLDIIGVVSIQNNQLFNWMHTSENAMIGAGSNFSFYYLIFFKTSPMLLILICYSWERKQKFSFFIGFLALFLSGTRANVFILLLTVGLLILFCYKSRNKFYVVSFLGIIAIIIGFLILPKIIEIFQNKASSDLVRTGHLKSVIDVFRSNPKSILIGTGFDSFFYSAGLGGYTNMIELSYLDLLRQVGLIGFIPLMYLFIFPIFNLWKNRKKWMSIALFCFLIICYTNPFLYSSTGYLFLVFAYSNVVWYKKKSYLRHNKQSK